MATEFGGQGENGESSVGNNIDVPTSQQEQIGLETARTILQAIVNTHENTINETTPLDQVAGYSTEQVRQAEKMVAQSLMEAHGGIKLGKRTDLLIKNTLQGRLRLSSGYDDIGLVLQRSFDDYVLANHFPLIEPSKDTSWAFGFTDYRSGEKRQMLSPEQSPLDTEGLGGIRYRWRGLRWMNANMLDWNNPNTIMPEQLDTLPLPSSQGKNKTT